MSNYHFIFNPIAGNGASVKAFAQFEALLKNHDVEYTVARSEYAGHAPKLAKEALAAGHVCIVAVGGDGTVREVAEALIGSNVPMCVLPCGTGNDMARALHIPRDPEALVELLLNGTPRAMDAGLANGTLYINVAGFGFDVDVLINTERYKKRFSGMTAYMLGLLRALFKLRLHRIRVTAADGVMHEHNALLVAAANGTHFGGGMNVAPEADPSDGLLDVCIISDVTRLTVLRVLMKFVKGKHLSLPFTTYFKAKEITVISDPAALIQLDGEVIGQTPVTFQVLPGVLQVIMGEATQNG